MQILSACTAAKRKATWYVDVASLALAGTDLESDAAEWSALLAHADRTTELRSLYKGAYWHGVQLLRKACGADSVWVMSAGLGLVSDATRQPAYRATFGSGPSDAIPGASTIAGRRAWWAALGGRAALRALCPDNGPLLVVLPRSYMRTALPDLAHLSQVFGDRMLVLSPGPMRPIGLPPENWVEIEARMARPLGVGVSAIAPAAACHILEVSNGQWDLGAFRRALGTLVPDGAPKLYPTRTKHSVEEVRLWLKAALAAEAPPSSASAALRTFRGEGRGFEQKHFHRLFREATSRQEALL